MGADRRIPVVAWPPRTPHLSTASWPPGEPYGRSGRFEVDRGATVPAGRTVELSQEREGVVLEDSGDDTVKLHEVTMRDLRGEGRIKVEGISIVSRSSLVLANRMK